MAATPASRRKFNTRGRGSTTPKRRSGGIETSYSEPPKKKRRYVPGGPGGGGRYVDADGSEIPVGGTGPGGYAYTGPRGTVGPRNAANGIQPPPAYERTERPQRPERPRRETVQRERPATRPRYSSAAAVAAAVVQGDGFKPREERGWEEFHQDLDLEADFPVFSAEEIDGVVKPAQTPNGPILPGSRLTNGIQANSEHSETGESSHMTNGTAGEGLESNVPSPVVDEPVVITPAPIKRRPGRPPRDPNAMLKGIGTPDAPKVVPLPGPNPREKLTLPKPSFRMVDPFASYEKVTGSVDYVDRTMANVGYQESDHFIRPEKALIRLADGGLEEDLDLGPNVKSDGDTNSAIGVTGVGRVEYDMDEQDQNWLEAYNLMRKEEQVEPIKPAIFEITMTKIEKEWHALEKRIPKPNPKPPQTHRPRSSSAAAVNGESAPQGEEQDSKCAICDDGDCENTNAIVFCDGCDLAVHQECYGVPFIPEGQWLCRKCHLIGRGTPTCIFCPNTDGAFKQTNSSKWSHLLCAIWIPEVSLGNTTFMEPVMEVEKVPKGRWKLRCSICLQAMGACIQCGNKNCFRAFHVTCGRRARWYLSMKSTHGGPASLDVSVLKAFCDKHVPPDWRKTYDVDGATADAISFYRYTMRGKIWADSQQSASSLAAAQRREAPIPTIEESQPKINLTFGGNRRKKPAQTGKTAWRLPSGAPVIPSTVYDSLEGSLARFMVRKRKEFAADMCRYWTLKREAKRGAALIKRLQLQMETFSSMEITRRNFAGMGAAGAVRLQRRIDFAEERIKEAGMLLELCKSMRDREALKLQDAEILRDIINTIYFPIPPLLWPIMDKALALDSKGFFRAGLNKIRESLEKRAYASVSPFSADLGSAFTAVIGMSTITDPNQIQSQINEDRATKKDLTSEDKDRRKLAKRIIKAVQGALEDANHKESELCRRPFEEELLDFDQLMERSVSSRRFSEVSAGLEPGQADLPNGSVPAQAGEGIIEDSGKHVDIPIDSSNNVATIPRQPEQDIFANRSAVESTKQSSPQNQLTPASSGAAPSVNGVHNQSTAANNATDNAPASPMKPPTPPLSSSDDQQTMLSVGGIPWYMEPFDPHGTTVYEERWTGREVARGMSEELSDMDEEELSGLVGAEANLEMQGEEPENGAEAREAGSKAKKATVPPSARKKNGRLKKRWRGFK